LLMLAILGCTTTTTTKGGKVIANNVKGTPPKPMYATLPPRTNLPAFMKGTIYEFADVENKEPYPVSGYGLVVGLSNTGDNSGTPLAVRNAIVDEMVRHGLGSTDDRLKQYKPEAMLRDPQTAIVEVYALLPPGSRAGQNVDIYVQAVQGSRTASLTRGVLYQCNLYQGGADPLNPKGKINTYVRARGPVFVNPGFAVGQSTTKPSASASLRNGMILGGGLLAYDRPLWLRARNPQLSMTRSMEMRVNQRFNDDTTAKTQDEGIVRVLVPTRYNGDWEHFISICTHLYLDGTPGLGAAKARAIVEEAVKPNAPLMDISYSLEAIGEESLPFIRPLYTHQSPDVAFAMARAGAFVGDTAAGDALLDIARADSHPFQLNAVKVLGSLPQALRFDRMLAELLSSRNALVRIEAYKVLAAHDSSAIISRKVGESFILDRVPCDGSPLIFATRTHMPRIAIFGQRADMNLPIMFSTLNERFSISSQPDGRSVMVFDRSDERSPTGVQLKMRPDVYELVWRLAGGHEDGFRFGYSDLVGILQGLSTGRHIPAAFVLEDLPSLRDAIEDAPPIGEPEGRPAASASAAAEQTPGSTSITTGVR